MARFLGFALAVLALAPVGLAQRTTGTLAGRLSDESGAALPGVAVTLRGAGVAGAPSTTSNEKGDYRFTALPPGSYEVSFALAGFRSVKRTAVRVTVGATTEENQTLALSALTDEVTVTGDASAVDTTSSEVGATYGREWVENAPLRRTGFADLVAAAPGTLQAGEDSGALQVYGSSFDENLYQLDGADVTDNFYNDALAQPSVDSIEEVEILSLGAPAEYGNLTGAVYNIVTRQGSNDFHGELGYYNQSDALTGRNTTEAQDGGLPFLRQQYHDLSAQFSGPIVKDKLWFFGAYQFQKDGSAPVGVDPAFVTRSARADRYSGKLNWQIAPEHRVQANLSLDTSDAPRPGGPNSAPTTFTTRKGKTPAPGASYTGVLSDRTTLEVRYSGFYGTASVEPLDSQQRPDLPRFYDLDTSQITGGWYYFYELDVSRTSVSAKVSHYADDFLGASHDFRFGVQYTGASAAGYYAYNDLVYTYKYTDYYGQTSTLGYGFQRLPFNYNGSTRGLAAYVDDTAKLNDRLSLSFGLRYDHNLAYSPALDELDASGRPTGLRFPRTEYFTWKNFSPRVGFNLKLTGDGKTVLKGHYGRYHRGIATGEFASVIGPSLKPVFFGAYDAATNSLVDLEPLTDNGNLSVDPDYSSPSTDQFILSLERELWKDVGLQATYVHKRGRNFASWRDSGGVYAPVEYVDDQGAGATGRTLVLQQLQNDVGDLSYQITNRPEMRTDVHAATLAVTRRMTGRWQLTASATFLRAAGRTPSSNFGSFASQRGGLQFNNFGRDPNDFVNSDGRLNGDIPWTAKVQFLYRLPGDFLFGLNYAYRTGANRVRVLRVGDLTNLPSAVFGEPRGSFGRLPDGHMVDARLAKDFKVGGATLGVSVDALNLFNVAFNEGVRTDLSTSTEFGIPDVFVLPRRVLVGAKLRF